MGGKLILLGYVIGKKRKHLSSESPFQGVGQVINIYVHLADGLKSEG